MYNKGLFADWVPKPMMLLLIIVFLFPILGVSGVFTNNLTDISGAMAAFNEHVQMANNAVTIGMSLSLPILMRVKMRFRTKEMRSHIYPRYCTYGVDLCTY
jgi:DHA2 family multidrug resistance protein